MFVSDAKEAVAPVRLLLVEDNPSDALLLQSTLDGDYPGQYATTQATTVGEAKALLGQAEFDAILLDLSLPDSQGLETIGRLVASVPDVPIIVLTGVADEAIAMEAVRCGAQDYLLKGQVGGATIARAIRYAMDRQRAEEELRKRGTSWRCALRSERSSWAVPMPNCCKPKRRPRRRIGPRAPSWPT